MASDWRRLLGLDQRSGPPSPPDPGTSQRLENAASEAALLQSQASVVQRVDGTGNLVAGRDVVLNVAIPPPQKPVHLARVIAKLADLADAPSAGKKMLTPYQIEEKIAVNRVVRYRKFIEETSSHFHAVEEAYSALAAASYPADRIRVQRYLREKFLIFEAERPNESGDECLSWIISETKALARGIEDVPVEVVPYCCDIIVAHAFVDCTILRSPYARRS